MSLSQGDARPTHGFAREARCSLQVSSKAADTCQGANGVECERIRVAVRLAPRIDELLEERMRLLVLARVAQRHCEGVQHLEHLIFKRLWTRLLRRDVLSQSGLPAISKRGGGMLEAVSPRWAS